MNWEMLKLDSGSESPKMPKEKRIMAIAMFVAVLVLVFIADDIQQRRFAMLEKGYEHMQKEEYAEAIDKFNEYLSIQSDLYWILIEEVNSSEYSRQEVNVALEACKKEMQNN